MSQTTIDTADGYDESGFQEPHEEETSAYLQTGDDNFDEDSLDEIVTEDEVAEQDSDVKAAAKPRRHGLRQAASKAIAKYVELTEADKEDVKVLAVVLGVKDAPATLAAAIIASPRVNVSAINDILTLAQLAKDSAFAAAARAVALEREQIRHIWAVLSSVGATTGNLPSDETKAALGVAEAIAGLKAVPLDRLERVRTLVRK